MLWSEEYSDLGDGNMIQLHSQQRQSQKMQERHLTRKDISKVLLLFNIKIELKQFTLIIYLLQLPPFNQTQVSILTAQIYNSLILSSPIQLFQLVIMKKSEKQNPKLSSKSIKHQQRQIDDEYYQKSQDKLQNQNNHILFFPSLDKAAFIYLRQKSRSLIQSILFGQLVNEFNIVQTDHLKFYLKKFERTSFFIQPKELKQALTDFKSLLLSKVTNIWMKLSEYQRNMYEKFGMRNKRMMKKFEGEQSVDKYSGFQMLKIDILCLFFLFSSLYIKRFKDISRFCTYSSLAKLFDLDTRHTEKMGLMFKQNQKDIQIHYRREVCEYVELFFIIHLSYQISSFTKANKCSFSSIPDANLQLDINFTQQISEQKDCKIRFCQIAYIPVSKLQKRRKSARYILQASASASAINHKRKQLLFDISKEYSISYHILLEINTKLDKNQSISKQQFVSYFEKNLTKCQWIFLRGRSSIVEGINAAFGNKFTNATIYGGDGRIGFKSFLTKLALERFALLSKIFNMQIKLEQRLTIYVYKFQYQFGDFQEKIVENIDQPNKDLKCSLVILVANSKILASTFCRAAMTQDLYLSLVKLCLKGKISISTSQFNLVIYDFDYERTLDTEAFTFFQAYMNKNFGARVYMLNDPMFFQPQFLINSFIISFLSKLNLSKQNFYQYFQVCVNKLLEGIQLFDKKTNEQYFAYFQKIMSLQIGVKDVWRCFKKAKGNKYSAVILGREDIEDQLSSNYLLQLDKKIPSQQWFRTIQYCQPSFQDFICLQEKESWRNIQQFKQQHSKELESLLKSKHMKEKDIKRILKDVAKILIDYQIYFEQLVSGKRKIKEGPETAETIACLKDFYNQQNKNIEQVYSSAERKAILRQFAGKYRKNKQEFQIQKINIQ